MSRSRNTAAAGLDISRLWHLLVLASFTVLFFARFYLPPEAAVQGDTLWIVQLWLICGLAWAIGIWKGAFPPVRLDWLDGAAALWIGGQVISAVAVILTTGDKRAAANLGWEWVGLGMVWLLARHGLVESSTRAALLRGLIVTGTILAAYGLYQHYVSHPKLVAEYGPLFDRLRAGGPDAAAIAQKFAREGIPTDGPALILYEKRLRDSHEPVALFALANTFGGFLAVCLLVTAAEILARRQRGDAWASQGLLLLAAAIMGWCLLLAKSRTAWVGLVCGMLVLSALRSQAATKFRRLLLPAGLSIAVVAIATGIVIAFGGLDRQVLSEAPKSLAFRFQYWQATRQLVAEHPWLGVGPGNFRQHYLKYKLPEASEEIADPHNLFFEIAATGGVLSVIGLAGFVGLTTLWGWRSTRTPTDQSSAVPNSPSVPAPWTSWLLCTGPLLAFAGSLGCWGDWEDRLLMLALVCLAATAIFETICRSPRSQESATGVQQASLAAFVALNVHLLGAGGIGMPGVSQLLVVFAAFSLPATAKVCQGVQTTRHRVNWGILTTATSILVVLSAVSILPVLKCRHFLREGDDAVWSAQGPSDHYHAAASADPWSPDPWRRLFEWTTSDRRSENRSNDTFQTAVEDLHEVLTRDPANFWAPRALGTVWHEHWKSTHDPKDIEQAVLWFKRAQERYPTNSMILSDLAFAMKSADRVSEAAGVAAAALRQDDINHQQGHVDRYLDESVRERLQAIVTEPQSTP